MYIPWNWKLCSFWLNVLAYAIVIAAVILCLLAISETLVGALLWLVYGVVGLIFFKALALFAKAAEHYLGLDFEPDEADE